MPPPLPPSHLPSPGPCTCANGSIMLKNVVPKNQAVELIKRREKEFQQHKSQFYPNLPLYIKHLISLWITSYLPNRTESVLSTRLYAPSNSPLQYPIQGFKVRPMTPTFIPGLALHAEQRSNYTVSLKVSKGVLRTTIPAARAKVQGNGESRLMMESSSLETLNELLANVSYTSTVYHIHTGDLASFQFEDHEAVFPVTIKQPQPPVLYDMGTDVNSQVTITTKTFLRYPQLKVLLRSIRQFYKDIEVIIADDSFVTEKMTGDHIQHYIMPPGKGWFAGRNLAVSQVTTKYFLWVDDDFLFTKWTKIEEMVKWFQDQFLRWFPIANNYFVFTMQVHDELVLGGKVGKGQFYSSLIYEEGDEMEGGCMYRKTRRRFHSLPGYPQCSLVSGVVNFFLARTDAVQRVRFDPNLKRVAHSEFFMDGLGSLMVTTCGHVAIGHQKGTKEKGYMRYANPQVHRITSTQLTGRFNTGLKCAKTKTPGVLFNHQGASKESTSLKDGMHLSSRFSATQRPLASGFRGAVQTQSKGVATTQSQYPIQGFKVRPMTPTFIPGMLHRTVCPFITLHCDTTEGCLALHAEQRSNYTVSLEVSEGVLRTTIPAKGVQVIVTGNGESRLMVESSSLEALNELLADVSYTSTIYHIHTGDLATFQFEDHEAVFPITSNSLNLQSCTTWEEVGVHSAWG
ncbi:hypothetical protein F7725_004100 [Dissostichus mawsoni]|uniref:Glycosyltransferase 2-like domain-containing protein n=1 Tax=Dissostichus mawsoni TaxID=36200 RepID=A0A7J5YC32_DISMA|nr:hypothetical protein F7725_004100 [Dissostichus mawsoni]